MKSGGFCGASDLTRTGDLLITSEMHYRLCYTSVFSPIIIPLIGPNVNIFLCLSTLFSKGSASAGERGMFVGSSELP